MAAAIDLLDLVFDPDARGEPAKEKTAGPKRSPGALQHGVEVLIIAREVENGTAQDAIRAGVGESHAFDSFDAKVGGGKGVRKVAHRRDGARVGVRPKHVVALIQEIDKITSEAAAGVENGHAGHDAAAKDLVKEVDVYLAEFGLQVMHVFIG
jgi:hypothetical protein